MSRPLATTLLLITTILWGIAFVPQKTALEVMGPLTFTASRFVLGSALLIPLAWMEVRRIGFRLSTHQVWLTVALVLSFVAGSILQQVGLVFTSVTNAGFLTGLYVFFTPLFALAMFRTLPHPIVWICAPVALLGIYLLNGGGTAALGVGDLLVVLCAVAWAIQIAILGPLARDTGLPITLSVMCFAGTALGAGVMTFALEAPTVAQLSAGWIEIAYAGILSTGVAFTLQAIAQQHVPAGNAAIILSAESLFAAIAAAILLGERLSPIGYVGTALIFAAILAVETAPILLRRNRPVSAG